MRADAAGVRASVAQPPGAAIVAPVEFPDTKPHAKSPTLDGSSERFVPCSVYSVHEFLVRAEDCDATWLESHERKRAFVPWDEALKCVAWRRGMAEALQRVYMRRA